jgi:hypothetical protein
LPMSSPSGPPWTVGKHLSPQSFCGAWPSSHGHILSLVCSPSHRVADGDAGLRARMPFLQVSQPLRHACSPARRSFPFSFPSCRRRRSDRRRGLVISVRTHTPARTPVLLCTHARARVHLAW